jgi:hypothetical protein
MTDYVIANLEASTSELSGEIVNYAALELAEFDAIEACGERGFLKRKAENRAAAQEMIREQ